MLTQHSYSFLRILEDRDGLAHRGLRVLRVLDGRHVLLVVRLAHLRVRLDLRVQPARRSFRAFAIQQST